MKKTFLLSLFTFSLSACITEKGEETAQTMDLDTIDQLEVSGPFEVHVRQGDEQEIIVIGHQNIIDKLQAEVVNGRLSLGLEAGSYHPSVDLEFFITLPELDAIDISGSGDVDIENLTTADLSLGISGSGTLTTNEEISVQQNLNISLMGSGSMVVQVNCENAISTIAGSGDVYLDGNSTTEEISISGSGRYGSSDFESENTVVDIDGSGSAYIFATQTLDVDISGSGSVYYSGNPEISFTGSGSGSVQQSFY